MGVGVWAGLRFALGDWPGLCARGDWPGLNAFGDWPKLRAVGDWPGLCAVGDWPGLCAIGDWPGLWRGLRPGPAGDADTGLDSSGAGDSSPAAPTVPGAAGTCPTSITVS